MVTFDSIHDSGLVRMLLDGGVGVLPTDTLYGVACRADLPETVARMYALTDRKGNPGTVIAASIDQLVSLGIKRRYLKAVEDYWPNAISIVIPVGTELNYITQSVPGVAVRIPSDAAVRNLLEQTGSLLTVSANIPDQPVAHTIAQAKTYFDDTIDFYADGGDLSARQQSTLIRIIDDAVEVLREGAVKLDLPD